MASYPFRICPQQNLVLYCFNMRSTHIVKVLHKINATLVQNLDNIRYLRCVITFYSVIYCCLKIHEMFFIKNLLLSSMFFFLNVTLENQFTLPQKKKKNYMQQSCTLPVFQLLIFNFLSSLISIQTNFGLHKSTREFFQ